MQHILIGRAGSGNDVELPHETVSAHHAELVRTKDGRLYLTDRASRNGTFVHRGGDWLRLRQDFVTPDEILRFGAVEILAGQLAAGIEAPAAGKMAGPVVWTPDGRLEAKR